MKALLVPGLFTGLSSLLAAGSAFTLAALTLAGPREAAADDALPIDGTFAVNFTATPTSPGSYSIMANGIGNTAHAGNLLFALQKTINFNDGTMRGTFTMTAENGDTLTGDYAGVVSPPDPKAFAPFRGQLTFTAGTGGFQNAKGTVSFTGLANLGTGQAVYSVTGGMSLGGSGSK